MATDWKKIGFGALDIVVGLGSAVAGGTGGGAAGASGVQMAGSAIKNLAGGDEEKKLTRAEKFERADFQTRAKAVETKRQDAMAQVDDLAASRAELRLLGYADAEIDGILSRESTQPKDGTSVAAVTAVKPASSVGSTIVGAQPTPIAAQEPENTGALAAIGKVLSGVMAGKS